MVSIRTAIYRTKVWVFALLHPATAAHVFMAFGRGLTVVVISLRAYLKGLDKLNLMAANPTAHDKETRRRRTMFWTGLAADAALFAVPGFLYGRWGLIAVTVLHVGALIFIGRRDPLIQPIYAKGLGREGMIIRIVDEITLSAAQRKAEAHSMIASPPARLAHAAGYEVSVRVHPEGDPEKLVNGAGAVAHKHRKDARLVYVYRVVGSDLIRIVVLDNDPWTKPPTRSSFIAQPRQLNLWRDALDFGTQPDGTRWVRRLVEAGDGGGQVVGGAPRQGKTVYLRGLACAVLLDPDANLRLIDGKAIDFAPAKPLCESYIGEPNMDDRKLLLKTITLLEEMVTETKRRREVLVRLDVDNLTEELARQHGMPTEWIMVDELAVFTEDMASTEKALVARVIELLGWLVRMGPAVGVFAVLATQRPSEKSLPPSIKGMILVRIGFRTGDQPASMAIMSRAGDAWRCDLLPEGTAYKGLSLVRDVGPVRMDLVTRDDLKRVVAYASEIRRPRRHDVPGDYPPTVAACLSATGEADRITSEELAERLGAGHTPQSVAEALKPYGVSPHNIRLPDGSIRKGYYRTEFTEVPKIII